MYEKIIKEITKIVSRTFSDYNISHKVEVTKDYFVKGMLFVNIPFVRKGIKGDMQAILDIEGLHFNCLLLRSGLTDKDMNIFNMKMDKMELVSKYRKIYNKR